MQRARNASSPKTPRIAGVPNMSAKITESSTPIGIAAPLPRPCVRRREGEGAYPRRDKRLPHPGRQMLERGKTFLVGHLRAVGDPIAQIDEGLIAAPAFLDEPQHAPDPEAALLM